MQVKGIFLKKLLLFSESFYFTFQEETTYLIDKKSIQTFPNVFNCHAS